MKRAGQVSQKVLWLLSVLASRVSLGMFFGLAMWAFLPMLIQWQSTIVISGSMEPGVSTGDIVVAQTYTQDEIRKGAVKVGDVTLARNPDKSDGSLITHRVIEIRSNGDFITKGDANQNADSTPLPRANVIGVERLLVPYIGIPINSLRNGDPIPVTVFGILALLAQMVVFKDNRNNRAANIHESEESDSGDKTGPSKKVASKVAPIVGGLVVVTALVAAISPVLTGEGYSRAGFKSSVPGQSSIFNASFDWTPPTVAMQQPVSPLKGTVAVTADATDDKSAIKNTVIQYRLSGAGTWTTLCTVAVAPYSCSWNTTTVADGNYDLRATTTDTASFSTTSETVSTTVANNMLVVLSSPGENVRETIPLSTTLHNTGTVTYTARVEYSLSGANSWKNVCTGLTSPYNCSWVTTGFANGDYDLRSVAVSGGTTFTSQVIAVTVDNLSPAVAMVDPASPISGNWTFEATASDAHSGVTRVAIQYALNGSSNYIDLCVFSSTPYSCRVDTTTIANGTYTFRAVADDAAGNRTISALVSNRVIDNTVSSVSMEDPGAFLTGKVTLRSIAHSSNGVASVAIQMTPTATSAWETVCTFATEPYTCLWNSAQTTNGVYNFRAVLTDSNGVVTTSAVVASRQVDNLALRGFDYQTVSGASTKGKLDAGDIMSFTYTSRVNLASITAGWTGTSIPVTVRLQDGALLGLGGTKDSIDVQRAGGTVNLGTVTLNGDYAKTNKTAILNATMTATTVTVNGNPATRIDITLGTVASGANGLRTYTGAVQMVWVPSKLATDLNGNPSSSAPVNEGGILDRDF